MGRKYLWRQHSYMRLEDSGHPGCIARLLRLLGYHHGWHNVKKKMLPYKRHGTGRRTKNSTVDSGDTKAIGFHERENVADEANPISARIEWQQVEWVNPPETGSVNKKPIRGKIRELMAEKLPEQPQPERIHLIETSNHGSAVDSSSEKLPKNVDVFEIFKVNKQNFLKILSDQDLALVNQSIKPNTLNSKVRLTKSGSFPAVNSSQMRYRAPSKLDDKKREIWPPLKGKDSANMSEDQRAKIHEESGDGSQGTSKGKLQSMRRASSLTESMDRYAQLFDSTFNKEIKRHLSRSLKLVNENDEPTPKFRRRLSLQESEFNSFLPSIEPPTEAAEYVPESTKDSAELDVNMKGNSFDISDKPCEDITNKAVNADIGHLEQRDEVEVASDCDAQENQDLVLQSLCKGDQMGNIKFPIPEDYELGPPAQRKCDLEKAENPEIPKSYHILPAELIDQKNNPEFQYVKLVLELSGFTMKDQTWVWYSLVQPLNPALFEQIETCYYPQEQPKCSTKMEEDRRARKLIFGLINEALVEIDERSCLYYPKALSVSCHVQPMPKGHRLLEEVWWFVGGCLDWRPELNPTLDFAAAKDLNRKHGWMNLQIESECVALELEDMILDELLDELILAC